jgi:hypothetical protein
MRRRAKEDVSKLPRWVQRRIEVLELNLASAQRDALAATVPGASNTNLHDFGGEGPHLVGLPPFSRVRFGTERAWIEVRLVDPVKEPRSSFRPEHNGCMIEVHSGTGSISVHPNVSNSICITEEDR